MRLVVYCGLVWIWNFDQPIQFEMPCPLWLRINESVDGDSILNPDGGVVFETLSMVTVFWNPDGGVMFAALSMVTVFLNPDNGVMFAALSMVTVSLNLDGRVVFITLLLNLSMVTAFITQPRWWGCIYNFVLREKHGVQFLPPVCERFLK